MSKKYAKDVSLNIPQKFLDRPPCEILVAPLTFKIS